MSDQPWEKQPSKLIMPVDRIVIEIDNRSNPPRINFLPSREMSIPFVINIFGNLIAQLSAQLEMALRGGMPQTNPEAPPKANPNGT